MWFKLFSLFIIMFFILSKYIWKYFFWVIIFCQFLMAVFKPVSCSVSLFPYDWWVQWMIVCHWWLILLRHPTVLGCLLLPTCPPGPSFPRVVTSAHVCSVGFKYLNIRYEQVVNGDTQCRRLYIFLGILQIVLKCQRTVYLGKSKSICLKKLWGMVMTAGNC